MGSVDKVNTVLVQGVVRNLRIPWQLHPFVGAVMIKFYVPTLLVCGTQLYGQSLV